MKAELKIHDSLIFLQAGIAKPQTALFPYIILLEQHSNI